MTQRTSARVSSIVFALCAACFYGFAQAQVPVIIQQPQPRIGFLGSNTLFDVVVSGVPNVRYQWRLNGGNVAGATSSTLAINNTQVADAGIYTVVAFTDSAAVTSDPAELQLPTISRVAFSDAFDGAPALLGTSGQVQSSNFGATPEAGEPAHAGRPPRRSVWATWTAPSGGIVTFRTAGSGFDTLLAVYTGNLTTGLVEARSDDDGGGFLTSQVSFRAQPQTTYHIVVDGFGGASGNFIFAWNFESTPDTLPAFTLEPNDQTVAPGSDVAFKVTGVTNYSWQWFFNGQLLTNETGTTLLITNASAASVGTYFCRGSNGPRTRNTRAARLELNANEFNIADPFAITTEKLFDSRLHADDFRASNQAKPKTVAHGFSGTQIFSTLGSTKEPGEPNHCAVPGGASEWFACQAETNGLFYIDTDGSNFDTVLAVYTGPGDSFSALVSVACDNNSGSNGKTSRVVFPATTGTIYWLAVDGVNDPGTGQPARGSVMLHYRLVLPLQLNAAAYTNTAGGKVTFRVSGTPNLAATIQATPALNTTNWVSLTTNSSPTGVFTYTNTGVNAFPNLFYRAVNRF